MFETSWTFTRLHGRNIASLRQWEGEWTEWELYERKRSKSECDCSQNVQIDNVELAVALGFKYTLHILHCKENR